MLAALDKSPLLSQLPADQVALMRATIQNSAPPTYELFLDSHHLVRRMVATVSMTVGGTAANGSFTFDLHYGTPVHLTAPNPSDVSSFARLRQALLSRAGR
jgi:hypothetical protein